MALGPRKGDAILMINSMKDFQIPTKLELEKDTASPTYGRFTAEPFERGFGTTMGNSLRRVLLSSLPGAAVTSVKIEGVYHEFSTIPGVTEDVTILILNIKALRLRLHSDKAKAIRLKKGPRRGVRRRFFRRPGRGDLESGFSYCYFR